MLARFLGNRLIHAPPLSFRFARAPVPCARPRWRLAGWAASALVALALLLSSGLAPASRGAGPGPLATGPALVAHDLRDGDPPLDEQHRELPAKKRRLDALLVQTSPPALAGPPGFHLLAAAGIPRIRPAAPGIAFDASIPAHRADPALRLHPGQAPPRAA